MTAWVAAAGEGESREMCAQFTVDTSSANTHIYLTSGPTPL